MFVLVMVGLERVGMMRSVGQKDGGRKESLRC